MAYHRASDELFIASAIKQVAEVGIENTRTRQVAECAGFTEATMFRRFPTKEILLREAFLYVEKKISDILTKSALVTKPEGGSFGAFFHEVWHKTYRYLIDHREETWFLIRYRYSSLYTEEVRSMRQAYNGAFADSYAVLEKHLGVPSKTYRGFLINYIFEMTLCFAEKVMNGRIEDDAETEQRCWIAISSAVSAWTANREGLDKDDEQ